MALAGIHAIQQLMLFEEKGLFEATLPDDCTETDRVIGESFEAIGKAMVVVARETTQPDSHRDYVELHTSKTPGYTQDNLFPRDPSDKAGLNRELVSLELPELRRHVCARGEHDELLEIFGRDGWWLHGITVEVVDFRGEDQNVRIHLMLADTRRHPWLNMPFPGQQHVLSYVYVTLFNIAEYFCERFDIGCDTDTLRSAATGRCSPEESFKRPVNKQTTGSLDEVMGRGTEAQFLQDLPKLAPFLRWFAAEYARA